MEMVDKLAMALEVFWAKAAKDRRLRREIEPTTDPVKVVEVVGGSVVGGKEVVVVVVVVVEVEGRKRVVEGSRVVESGTEGPGYGRDSSRLWFTDGTGIEWVLGGWVNQKEPDFGKSVKSG